jgi:hypothetical protein
LFGLNIKGTGEIVKDEQLGLAHEHASRCCAL